MGGPEVADVDDDPVVDHGDTVGKNRLVVFVSFRRAVCDESRVAEQGNGTERTLSVFLEGRPNGFPHHFPIRRGVDQLRPPAGGLDRTGCRRHRGMDVKPRGLLAPAFGKPIQAIQRGRCVPQGETRSFPNGNSKDSAHRCSLPWQAIGVRIKGFPLQNRNAEISLAALNGY